MKAVLALTVLWATEFLRFAAAAPVTGFLEDTIEDPERYRQYSIGWVIFSSLGALYGLYNLGKIFFQRDYLVQPFRALGVVFFSQFTTFCVLHGYVDYFGNEIPEGRREILENVTFACLLVGSAISVLACILIIKMIRQQQQQQEQQKAATLAQGNADANGNAPILSETAPLLRN